VHHSKEISNIQNEWEQDARQMGNKKLGEKHVIRGLIILFAPNAVSRLSHEARDNRDMTYMRCIKQMNRP
jgi:hypothetical protein